MIKHLYFKGLTAKEIKAAMDEVRGTSPLVSSGSDYLRND